MSRTIVIALALFASGCQQILDIPNPDEVKELGYVAERLCDCPYLGQQGSEASAACASSIADATEEKLQLIAEAECNDCENVESCYGLATGATDAGNSCQSYAACTTFACCATNIGGGVFGGVITEASCCASCVGCGEFFAPGTDWAVISSGVCVESADLFVEGSNGQAMFNLDNEIVALGSCLCQNGDAVFCIGMDACPPSIVGDSCFDTLSDPQCRDCMTNQAGDACKAQRDACDADGGRPHR